MLWLLIGQLQPQMKENVGHFRLEQNKILYNPLQIRSFLS